MASCPGDGRHVFLVFCPFFCPGFGLSCPFPTRSDHHRENRSPEATTLPGEVSPGDRATDVDRTSQATQRARVVRLLVEHRSAIFAFILTAVRDYDVAEEVFQEVSVAICESFAGYTEGTSFTAWAREIARRRILAQWRSDRRFPLLLSDTALAELSEGFAEVESQGASRQRKTALRACLESLKPASRRLLELRYASRLQLAEIADRVNRHGESVRKALYRIRQFLRQCVERRLRAEEAP